jgi:NAD+ synthase (glutamine-hydrolysing)
MEVLAAGNPQLLINIAASPFTWNQESLRMTVLRKNVEQYGLPLLYVNHVGAQTELLFDGNSKVIDRQGHQVVKLKAFEEDFTVVEFREDSGSLCPVGTSSIPDARADKPALIHDALVMGIRDYFSKMGFSRAILGLSGGIDSAVTLALAVKALGAENVRSYSFLHVSPPNILSTMHANWRKTYTPLMTSSASKMGIRASPDTVTSVCRTEFNITEENIQAGYAE